MYTPRLSPRETEVLEQIVEGKQVKVIAYELSISSETVRHYIKRIYKELDVHNRADVVRVALRTPGLLALGNAPVAPGQEDQFVGREADLQQIRTLLDRSRIVCIVGMGGIGKTCVAQLLSQELDGAGRPARLVDLRNTSDAEGFCFQIAQALDFDQRGAAGNFFDAILRHAASAKGTLILDNFEQLAGEAGRLDQIVRASADLSIIVTSRIEIESAVAVHYPLGGLKAEDTTRNAGSPAVSLFKAACRQVAPQIEFDDRTVHVADQICDMLGGSPLAIKLASSWLDALSVEQIRDALETGSDILANPRVERSDHGNMAQVIRATLDFRSASERALLERLSVFAGPFDASAALAVAACSATTLATLVRAALVQKEPGSERSYSLHPLLRETLMASFATAKDHCDTLDRFCAYYLAPETGEGNADLRLLDTFPCRGRNLLHAWDIALGRQDFDALVASAHKFAEQMLLAGRGAEALTKLEAGVKILARADHPDRKRLELDMRLALVPVLMTARGHSASETGQNARRTVELARSNGDDGRLFRALWSAARFEMVRQDNGTRILSLARECHGVGTRTGSDQDEVLSENLLGGAYFFVGDFVAAERHLSVGVAIYDPDRHGQLRKILGQDIGALNHIQQSWTLFYLGRDADALKAARCAEALTFRLGDAASRGWYLVNAACLHYLRGDFRQVHALASEGLPFARDAEIEQMISGLCLLNGGARIMLGEAEAGRLELEEGLDIRRKHGLGPVTSWVADLLCGCHFKLGNHDQAERLVRFGIDHAEASGCGPSHSELERHLGQIMEDRGDFDQAEAAYRRALEIADRQGAKSLSLRAIGNQLALGIREERHDAFLVALARRMSDDLRGVDTKEAAATRDLAMSFL